MDAAGSLAGPGKRQRRGPPGLTLLARSREMGELKAGGLVFAAWVERHNTLAPEVVYCCSTQLGAVAKASVQAVLRQLASEHLLDSHCRGLTLSHISVVELSRYELAGGGAKPPPEELPPEAPADPRRSFKYRLKRLVDAAEQCSDGPFVAYVLSTGHKPPAAASAAPAAAGAGAGDGDAGGCGGGCTEPLA